MLRLVIRRILHLERLIFSVHTQPPLRTDDRFACQTTTNRSANWKVAIILHFRKNAKTPIDIKVATEKKANMYSGVNVFFSI